MRNLVKIMMPAVLLFVAGTASIAATEIEELVQQDVSCNLDGFRKDMQWCLKDAALDDNIAVQRAYMKAGVVDGSPEAIINAFARCQGHKTGIANNGLACYRARRLSPLILAKEILGVSVRASHP